VPDGRIKPLENLVEIVAIGPITSQCVCCARSGPNLTLGLHNAVTVRKPQRPLPTPMAPTVTVSYSQLTAHVGDTVTLTVTVTNGPAVSPTVTYGVGFPTRSDNTAWGVPLFTSQLIVLPQSFGCYQGRGVVNGYRTASRSCVSVFQPNEVKKFVITETALRTGTL
jgi:hypothetical protein